MSRRRKRRLTVSAENAATIPAPGTVIGLLCVMTLCLVLSDTQTSPQTSLPTPPPQLESVENHLLVSQPPETREPEPTAENARRRLARDIRDAVRRIQSIRTKQLQRAREHQQVLAELDEKTDSLASQSADMQRSLDAQQVEIETLNKQVTEYQLQLSQHQQRLSQLAVLTARTANRVRKRAGRTRTSRYPEHAERLGRITSKLKERSQPLPQLSIQIRAARSFLETMEAEWSATRGTTLSNDTVAIDNGQRQVHAWILDIGLVGSLFVSEDERDCGIGIVESGEKWLTDLPTQTDSDIKRMLRIARRRQPAALTAATLRRRPQSSSEAEAK